MSENHLIGGEQAGTSGKAEGPHSAFLASQSVHPVLQQIQQLTEKFGGTCHTVTDTNQTEL